MSKAQQLQAIAATLSEPIAAEVLDFLDVVTTRKACETAPRVSDISRFRGAFKGQLSSSNEFATSKADEIRMEG